MGNQACIDIFTTSPVEDICEVAIQAVRFLGGREDIIKLTRYSGLDNSWAERNDSEELAPDFVGRRMPLSELAENVTNGKTHYVQWFRTEESLRRQFTLEVWESLPKDLLSEHAPGNDDLILGEHDIFGVERQGEEDDSYLARATFSVHMWGYRCPADIDRYRELVVKLPSFKEIQRGLSEIIPAPVECRIYMNL